jgi:hypothetical protein
VVSEGQRHVVHTAFHQVVPRILQHGAEKPGELGAACVVGGVCHEQGEGAEQALHLLGLEGLVAPRAHALQAEAVLVHPGGAPLQRGRLG